MEKAMAFIDEHAKDEKIDRAFVSELHKMIVDGLEPPPLGEGDTTPGMYRQGKIKIARSLHLPPEHVHVEEYMSELYEFIHSLDQPKYDLLKTAIAH
jgi:Fic family protein